VSIVIASPLVLFPQYGLNNPFFGYQNLITGATADSEDDDHPASNLLNVLTFPDAQWWSESTAAQNIAFTVASTDDCDYAAIAGHNFGTAGISVKWQAYNGATWDDLTNDQIPGDDGPLIFRYAAQPVNAGIRMVLGAGSEAPRCAVAYVGPSLISPRRLWVGHSPLKMARATDIVSGMSEASDFLGRIQIGESVGTTIDLKNLPPGWYRENFDPFIVAAKTRPFFFAWRPVDHPDEVGFCWVTNQPKPTNARRASSRTGDTGMMSVQLQVNGIV
jgi:hypothetical protein